MTLTNESAFDGVESSSTQPVVNCVLQSIYGSRQLALEEKAEIEEEEATFFWNQISSNSMEPQRSIYFIGRSDAGQGSFGCNNSLSEDRAMCLQHEAGHFLVGYLLGVLPKRYKIPTMEDLLADNFAGGKIEFHSFEFLSEVNNSIPSNPNCTRALRKNRENRRIVSSKTLDRFLCVILGGLVAEQLKFGYSELLHSDVQKLDRVLGWLGFDEIEASSQTKWAATNSVLILRQHQEITSRLAEAMSLGLSIGGCIDVFISC